MHIVTKFLVLMAAVLSVLLSGLTIAYTSNASRLVQDHKDSRAALAKAEGQAASVTAAAAGERESQQSKIAALEATLQESAGRMSSLQAENARLLAEVGSLKQASLTHTAQIDQFTAVVQTFSNVNRAQADELGTLRDKELDHAKKEIQLSDRINDLLGELEVVRETNRSLQEQLVAFREGGQSPAAGVLGRESSTSGGEVFLRAPAEFRGRIVDVRKDEAGNTLASISGGTGDRLKERMRLNIVRDGFLAMLVLQRVDENESVGRVDFLGREGTVDVRQGDLVVPTFN